MQPANSESQTAVQTKKPIFWIFVTGLIGLALYFGVNSFVLNSSTATTEPEEAARSAERVKNLEDVKIEESEKLNTYGWADKNKGEVRIPVELAMKLILPDLNSRKPAPAYPILDATGQPIPSEEDSAVLPQDPATEEPAAEPTEVAPTLPNPTTEKSPETKKPQ